MTQQEVHFFPLKKKEIKRTAKICDLVQTETEHLPFIWDRIVFMLLELYCYSPHAFHFMFLGLIVSVGHLFLLTN